MTTPLSAADIEQMKTDVALVISSSPTSVSLRRGSSTLTAQTVLLANRRAVSKVASSETGQEARQIVQILGELGLDIQRDDRFTVGGRLYRVISVRPDYPACVQAEAEAIE